MPHECTSCGYRFPDGSKEMLSGCPECGGNKFQFIPASSGPDDPAFELEDEERSDERDDIIVADDEPVEAPEDRAQASARSAIVSEDELPSTVEGHGTDDRSEPESREERPDLSELREELNDQFESIKIHQPGEYELNLMELYDREERIVALEEDGRYVIDVPSSWHEDEGE